MVKNIQAEITKAIGTYDLWKDKLKASIADGRTDQLITSVCQDNLCEFGIWLYGLEVAVKTTPRWHCVRTLHADFHRVAGNVLQLAISGQKDQANEALSSNGQFSNISAQLTSELKAWAQEAK